MRGLINCRHRRPCFPACFRRLALKTKFKVVGAIVVLAIAAAFVLPYLVNLNNFRSPIESQLSSALGRAVKIGNLRLNVFSGSVGADQLLVGDDPRFSNTPFIQAKTLRVGVELIPLIFKRQLSVTGIVIGHPEINLFRNAEGVWNFSSLGNPSAKPAESTVKSASAPANVSVSRLELTDGTITLGSIPPKRPLIVYDKVKVEVRDFSFTAVFPLTASVRVPGGGNLKIDGTAGPINTTDTALTPLQAELKITKLDLSQSPLIDPQLGIAGTADFDGNVSSDGRVAKARGTVRVSALKLAAKGSPAKVPVQVVFAVEHDLHKDSGKVSQGDVAIGKALAKLTGTYDLHGETPSINVRLNGQAMPVDDLQGMLPALGIILPPGSQLKGGMLAVELDSSGALDKLVSVGWVRMTNASLAGFNLGSKLSSITALTGKQMGNDTTIQNLSSDIRRTPEGTHLDKINVVIPSLGTVTGAGTISPTNALDFKMVANLAGVGASLTKVAGFGSGGVPLTVGGTISNPTFTPDMKEMMNGKIKELTGGKGNPLSGLFGKKKP